MNAQCDISIDTLPEDMPIFPLPRVILLPRVQLPLNIFEKRYLAMTTHAMNTHRLIGMVQVKPNAEQGAVYATGCAGRIVSYSETDDGRYLITLKGVCRFNIAEELPQHKNGFRRVRPDWKPFARDLIPDAASVTCKDALSQTLRAYFEKTGLSCDRWQELKEMTCERLISTLSVVCPFDALEKQALLEAPALQDRARLLQSIMETALGDHDPSCTPCCH
jgi:uncharacterized protein